ncbi:MAG TPA: right-handed parallel beta-helix repeat-containing protein [Anaeromyxobacter sp.]|nr:right-handed parallel beta-helix repeat-containing protein [Anaeromyxobacter sp.]
MSRHASPRFLALSLVVVCACSSQVSDIGSAAQGVDVSVLPKSALVPTGQEAQFIAQVTGTANLAVAWQVLESGGGTVDSTGLYVAPATAGIFHVVAQSLADTTQTAAATVTVAKTQTPPTGSCATAAEPTSNVVYVCDCQAGADAGCVAGSDSSAGTSKSAPKQTFAAARTAFNALPAGGTVLMCKGGRWSTGTVGWWSDTKCTQASPCTLRDYQASWGGSSKPTVTFTNAGYGMEMGNSGAWEHGYNVWNIKMVGVHSNSGTNAGVFFWGDVDYVDLCNLEISDFTLGVQIGGWNGSPPGGDYNAISNNITLRNSYLHDNGNYANASGDPGDGWLGSCDNCTIDSNIFENNGVGSTGHTAYMFQHHMYLSGMTGQSGAASNMRVTNNEFYTHDVQCAGTRFVIHGSQSGLLVENNLFQSTVSDVGCFGFQITDGGYGCGVSYTGSVIRGNRFYGPAGNVVVSVDHTVGTIIEDNIVQVGVGGAVGIKVPNYTNTGCFTNSSNATVRNNTVHLLASGTGIQFLNEGSGHVDANNAVYTPSGGTCNSTGSASMAYLGSNWCDSTSPFADVANGNYTPTAGGPLAGTGNASYAAPLGIPANTTWSSTDPLTSRTTPVDIGAVIQ